ncbi:MAG: fibronectin type III domain-containing protein [Desulfomonile sp.]|nr:fibronectin type III domain-containing protein [Desulfomonile sp.]
MRTAIAVTVVVIAISVVVGCGYKTNPRPATATIPGEVGLVSARAYPDRIVLTWDVPSGNTDGSPLKDLSGFKVYRSTQKVGEQCENCEYTENVYANVDAENPVNAVITQGQVLYTDRGVNTGTIYHYSVTPYNLKGREGERSQIVTVTIDDPPPAPTGVQVSVDARGIVLRWERPEADAGIRSYRIYRGSVPKADEMKAVGNTRSTETYFVDRDAEKGKTYFYTVRSVKLNQGIPLESLASVAVKETMPTAEPESHG